MHRKYIFIVIFLHLALVLPLAYFLNIWIDEGSSLYTTGKGFFWALENAHIIEKQAPLYFLLLSLWRSIDPSIFFARVFSIICSCLAVKIFYNLTNRVFKENQAKFLTALFAFHPFLIWASLEIRVYSLVILLSIGLLKLFFDGYLDEDVSSKSAKAQGFFVITAIIALYTNYYLGFLLVGCFLALLVLKRWPAAKTYFWQMLIALLAIVPLFWIIRAQFTANTGGAKEISSLLEGLRLLWGHFLTFIVPTELFPAPDTTIVSIMRVWIVRLGILAVIALLVKNKFRAIDEKVFIFGTVSATIAAFLLAAYFLLGGEYISLRHASILFVPLILAVASISINLVPKGSWRVFAVFFILLFSYSIYSLYPGFAKSGDWARVGQFIEAHEKPGQPIVVFLNYDAVTVPYHYKGINKILPDEKFFDWSHEDVLKSENAFRKQIAFTISEIPPDSNEIWLITRASCYREEMESACRPLEYFVEAHYTIELEKDFYAEKVRLLRKK